MNRLDMKILSELFKSSSGLEPFTIYSRCKVGLTPMMSSLAKLEKKGLVSEGDGEALLITKLGVEYLVMARKGVVTKEWKEIPSSFRKDSSQPRSLYVPKRSLLDKRTFNV